MKNNKKKSTGIINIIFVILFIVFYFFKFFLKINTKYINLILIIIGCLAFAYLLITKPSVWKRIMILLLVDMCALLGMVFNKNYPIPYWFLALSFQGIALVVIYCPKKEKKYMYQVFLVFFWLFIAMLTINMLLGRGTDAFFNKASENFISILLIGFFFLYAYYIMYYRNRKYERIAVLWLICMFFSIYSNGRMGILVFAICGLLFVISLLYKNIKHKKLLIFTLVSVSIFLLALVWIRYEKELDSLLSTEGRLELWSDYFKETKKGGLLNVIFGTPFTKNETFVEWNKNLHNSFLQLHMMYGIAPCIAIIIASLKFLLKKNNLILKALLVCLLLRSMTDSFIIGELCDIPLYMIAFPYLSYKTYLRRVFKIRHKCLEAC